MVYMVGYLKHHQIMFMQASRIKIFRSLHDIYAQHLRLLEIITNCCRVRNKNVLYNNDA